MVVFYRRKANLIMSAAQTEKKCEKCENVSNEQMCRHCEVRSNLHLLTPYFI